MSDYFYMRVSYASVCLCRSSNRSANQCVRVPIIQSLSQPLPRRTYASMNELPAVRTPP